MVSDKRSPNGIRTASARNGSGRVADSTPQCSSMQFNAVHGTTVHGNALGEPTNQPTSSTVPALLATLVGWFTGITQRLTDRHRPCRQAVDELAALVTAERDRARWVRADLKEFTTSWLVNRVDFDGQVAATIHAIANELEGPAPNRLNPVDLSNPQAPTNPSADHG